MLRKSLQKEETSTRISSFNIIEKIENTYIVDVVFVAAEAESDDGEDELELYNIFVFFSFL